jgi:hypothetical protein
VTIADLNRRRKQAKTKCCTVFDQEFARKLFALYARHTLVSSSCISGYNLEFSDVGHRSNGGKAKYFTAATSLTPSQTRIDL